MLTKLGATLLNNLYLSITGRYCNATSVGELTQAISLSNFLSGFISTALDIRLLPQLKRLKRIERG